jgi:hypothetical protein
LPDDTSRLLLELGVGVRARWMVRLSNASHGHMLDREVRTVTYHRMS